MSNMEKKEMSNMEKRYQISKKSNVKYGKKMSNMKKNICQVWKNNIKYGKKCQIWKKRNVKSVFVKHQWEGKSAQMLIIAANPK